MKKQDRGVEVGTNNADTCGTRQLILHSHFIIVLLLLYNFLYICHC
jgi:hypothetical protein